MIDFHCHLDLYPNPTEIVAAAESRGMYLLAVTTTPRAWEGNRKFVASVKRSRIAIGLHPELVAERRSEVDLLCEMLPRSRYVGEIGLDGTPRHKRSLTLQRKVLDRILDACATEGGRVMTVHSRGAVSPLLDALEYHPDAGTAVLHWFTGSVRELERAVQIGCWFSVGPSMVAPNSRTIKLVKAMPRGRLLTETDGPLAERNGAGLKPWDVAHVVRALAQLWECSFEAANSSLQGNLRRLIT